MTRFALLESTQRPRRRGTRARTGTILSQSEYRNPILETLGRLGGEAEVPRILEGVHSLVKDRLTELDNELVPSGIEIRWKIQAMFQRKKMIADGLLDSAAPRGVWRLSEEGWAVARRLLRTKGHNG